MRRRKWDFGGKIFTGPRDRGDGADLKPGNLSLNVSLCCGQLPFHSKQLLTAANGTGSVALVMQLGWGVIF